MSIIEKAMDKLGDSGSRSGKQKNKPEGDSSSIIDTAIMRGNTSARDTSDMIEKAAAALDGNASTVGSVEVSGFGGHVPSAAPRNPAGGAKSPVTQDDSGLPSGLEATVLPDSQDQVEQKASVTSAPESQGTEETAAAVSGAQGLDVPGDHAAGDGYKGSADAGDGTLSTAQILEIPFQSFLRKGMITPQNPRSQIAEEYRTIKRPLLLNTTQEAAASLANANLIMVTSALQGDGKTFSAINLALSIAMEQDKTVLFVDADVAKASAGDQFGVPEKQPGLINLLDGTARSPADVILRTNVQNLRVLPAGNLHERSTELLASNQMRRLMLEFSQRYSDRVIVFDSPPLLLTTEASVLASFMGQIVFVVSADQTPQHAVTEAIRKIAPDKVIGMVLNRAKKLGFGRGSYGYGYGYSYGRRGDADESVEETLP